MTAEKGWHIRDGAYGGEMVVGGVLNHGLRRNFLGGKNDTYTRCDTHAVETFAHHGSKAAGVAVGDVGSAELRGVEFAAAAHAADRGKTKRMGMIEEKHLGREGVDAINNTVVRVGLEELNHAVVAQEFL